MNRGRWLIFIGLIPILLGGCVHGLNAEAPDDVPVAPERTSPLVRSVDLSSFAHQLVWKAEDANNGHALDIRVANSTRFALDFWPGDTLDCAGFQLEFTGIVQNMTDRSFVNGYFSAGGAPVRSIAGPTCSGTFHDDWGTGFLGHLDAGHHLVLMLQFGAKASDHELRLWSDHPIEVLASQPMDLTLHRANESVLDDAGRFRIASPIHVTDTYWFARTHGGTFDRLTVGPSKTWDRTDVPCQGRTPCPTEPCLGGPTCWVNGGVIHNWMPNGLAGNASTGFVAEGLADPGRPSTLLLGTIDAAGTAFLRTWLDQHGPRIPARQVVHD